MVRDRALVNMKAAVLTEYGEPLEIETVPRPALDNHGAIVQVEACGICRSDWHGWQGDWEWLGNKPPIGQILGHEPAGTVVETGPEVTTVQQGDRIAVPFNLADGSCSRCLTGHSHKCENGRGLGFSEEAPGAFAEEVHVPYADVNAVDLPDDVSPTEMAGLGCRFMTAFHALSHRADVDGGDWVAVHGCGGIGLSAVDIACALGANVVAVDLDDEKLEMASNLGAVKTVNASEADDTSEAVKHATNGGADVSIDALGIAETCRNSLHSLDLFGQHVQIGLTTQEEEGQIPIPTDEIVANEITFIGAGGMPPTRYDEILDMVEYDQVHPEAVVTNTVTLEEVPDRLDAMTQYNTMGIEVITEF
jgi:D-arabinose 1-dehydrogenase-like Zn-dependent alcohol dehydrogenase